MCGIAGWYRRGGLPVTEAIVRAQCRTIVHRGPDDEGLFTDRDFGFGMRRLSVLDPSGGHQPMRSADGSCHIVFNGEVYNFAELRRELQALGRSFRTRSDTEVVLEAFAAWGDAAWPRLEGMFAVAIWHGPSRSLHLARDPLGIKPLYWTLQRNGIAFASELKALGPVPGLVFDLDPTALEQYVSLGAVLAPRSIYRSVFKLPPGCSLRIAADGEPTLDRFWQLKLHPREDLGEEDWVEECRSRLLASVQQHLVADVPLGAFLSGGVDSSAVVAAMSRLSQQPVQAFTIGFSQPRYDETAIAAQVATHLGCVHHVQRLEARAAPALLEQLARIHDEPFADDSAMPTWLVSRLAREHVTVALSGDGGDELFAGYRRHRAELQLSRLKRLPGAQFALDSLARFSVLPASGSGWQRLHKLATHSALHASGERNIAKQYRTSEAVLAALWGREVSASDTAGFRRWAAELFGNTLPADPLQAVLFADTTVWLPDGMLVKVDRASMAHSLEVRVPMLSHRFVDWAATVPAGLKLRGRVGKYLLRRAIEPWLPAGILDRPKQGFAVPVSDWLRGDFGRHALAAWNDSGVEDSGLFRPGAMAGLLRVHRGRSADHAAIIYTLLMFAHWWPTRLLGKPVDAVTAPDAQAAPA